MILEMIYKRIAIVLNNYENHRTETEYEDHLITKLFLFQFVNAYIALFYVAFYKPYQQLVVGQPIICKYIYQTLLTVGDTPTTITKSTPMHLNYV